MEPRCGTPHSYQQMLGVMYNSLLPAELERCAAGREGRSNGQESQSASKLAGQQASKPARLDVWFLLAYFGHTLKLCIIFLSPGTYLNGFGARF